MHGRAFAIGMMAVVAAAVVAGLVAVGGPGEARRDRFDMRRYDDLAFIANALLCANKRIANPELPEKLTVRDSQKLLQRRARHRGSTGGPRNRQALYLYAEEHRRIFTSAPYFTTRTKSRHCARPASAPNSLLTPTPVASRDASGETSPIASKPGGRRASPHFFFAMPSSFSERMVLRWSAASFSPSMPKATAISWE